MRYDYEIVSGGSARLEELHFMVGPFTSQCPLVSWGRWDNGGGHVFNLMEKEKESGNTLEAYSECTDPMAHPEPP